ncbi:hypothetical protein QVD17_01554 [Tagetes erecta]|uniref:RING-type E3 ubiquitin transferase n=1 Tax=Tagetes erecta TaxID=13708 RepID=A0AAD8L537_TARER|nr:hypothetical protein QVD17_01554 [Tagetes erecta]
MGRFLDENRQENGIWVELPAPSEITISPVLLWVIVSMAAIFFMSGIIHVLLKFYKKDETYPSISNSIRYTEFSRPQSLGRQLQQLFRLQDSGLDPSLIESLPVFEYKRVMGTKYPFDCAVCLCEFSPHDKLRLIPYCSHAFHTHCIDTWLLSNSTCPLCRVNLSTESALSDHNGPLENFVNVSTNSIERVFSVRLGKLKSFKGGERSSGGEISRCNLDARRCFSMGSFHYVVDNVDMQVTLFDVKDKSEDNEDLRKIKHESLSVSKVWLWSKKGKFPVSSSETEVGGVSSSQNIILSSV